jgi:transcriptional regulator with XRE-family HTH domain
MTPVNRPDLLDLSIGRESLTAERLARIAQVSVSTVDRWRNGELEPRASHVERILAATELPASFRQSFAETFFVNCPDLHVVYERAPESDSLPLPVTFDVSDTVTEIQRVLTKITCPNSQGGRNITVMEGLELDKHMHALKALVNVQLIGAVNKCRLGKQAG